MYPSTEELVTSSTVSKLTDLTPEQQDALRAEAIGAVERYCRQRFVAIGTEEEPSTVDIDGSGSSELYLPSRLAVLTDLNVSDGSLSVDDVGLNADRDRLNVRSDGSQDTWITRALARERGLPTERVFPLGTGEVEVTGVWGWPDDEFPDDVTTALRFHMEDRALTEAHKLAETVRAARALGVTGVQQGGLSIELGAGEPEISTRVRRLLRDLRWDGGPVGALA